MKKINSKPCGSKKCLRCTYHIGKFSIEEMRPICAKLLRHYEPATTDGYINAKFQTQKKLKYLITQEEINQAKKIYFYSGGLITILRPQIVGDYYNPVGCQDHIGGGGGIKRPMSSTFQSTPHHSPLR